MAGHHGRGYHVLAESPTIGMMCMTQGWEVKGPGSRAATLELSFSEAVSHCSG